LDRATGLGHVVFTLDEDLLVEAARRQHAGESFGGVVYVHMLQAKIGPCLQDLEILAKVLDPKDMENVVQYLPL
jgi:hypothetical protein